MPLLSEKLKALGVKVGARELQPVKDEDVWPISRTMPGRNIVTPPGDTYLVEAIYPSPLKHSEVDTPGKESSIGYDPLELIATWAGDQRILTRPLSTYAFLDIETTGLSGGTGTYAFLVGIARYENEQLHLAQFFMRDPNEEAAHLYAVEEFLASCEVLVTFNGKAFDAPLLATRFLTYGIANPIRNVAHLDLLHLSRRLWRDRLPNRSLGSLEVDILGLPRTLDDIPGWQIPQMYFDYLHTGDARPLSSVFYHNAVDIVSLASLFDHISHLLHHPHQNPSIHPIDLTAIARLFDDLDRWQDAIPLYKTAIDQLDEGVFRLDAIRRLSFLYKRHNDWENAVLLWREAAEALEIYAMEELAKYHEHSSRLLDEAMHWTLTALAYLNDPSVSSGMRVEWLPEFQHRLERLKRLVTTKQLRRC